MLVAGVDEAGRGPLIGNVVAAAVILDPAKPIKGLADSKKLSEKRRNALYEEIIEKALAYHIAVASPAEIDDINILHASLLAMKRAVEGLGIAPEHVLVDGNRLPVWHYSAEAIVKGDAKEACISAASILAKVTRDQEMVVLDAKCPGYGFAKHKGYPTKMHMEQLKILGVLPEHRRSFGPVRALCELNSGE
ncbi:ribonuclease HII [Marinagarivorans algicola]|uniref:ribonuclease HII n=1 Tax=Marinagarivorans algicola TaxID=1513270 RepID=UPI0006BA01F6|nr:ribonuclease HII [Marinagarivorans algicola]